MAGQGDDIIDNVLRKATVSDYRKLSTKDIQLVDGAVLDVRQAIKAKRPDSQVGDTIAREIIHALGVLLNRQEKIAHVRQLRGKRKREVA